MITGALHLKASRTVRFAEPLCRARDPLRGYTPLISQEPNYFGDACVWWGIGLVAAETGAGAWGLIGAVVMTYLLRRVSGVTMLEKTMAKRRPGYTEYVATTSPFIPRPPKH